jgi:hypothetical protein
MGYVLEFKLLGMGTSGGATKDTVLYLCST